MEFYGRHRGPGGLCVALGRAGTISKTTGIGFPRHLRQRHHLFGAIHVASSIATLHMVREGDVYVHFLARRKIISEGPQRE